MITRIFVSTFCFFLLCTVLISEALACYCKPLSITESCVPDAQVPSGYSSAVVVFNPNNVPVTATWLLMNIPGSAQTVFKQGFEIVPSQAFRTLTIPFGGSNIVEMWINGKLEKRFARTLTCDCTGTLSGTQVNDDCGVCGGGNAAKGCDGVCFSNAVNDSCGVCAGNNAAQGCDAVCFSQKVVDTCGVCGGDGQSCIVVTPSACVATSQSSIAIAKANAVKAKGIVIHKRTIKFANDVRKCSGKNSENARVQKSLQLLQKIDQIFSDTIMKPQSVCPTTVCTQASNTSTKSNLAAVSKKLSSIQIQVKRNAIKACKTISKPDNRNRSDYYLQQLLKSVSGLPATRLSCK